jgi:hypothetical protein
MKSPDVVNLRLVAMPWLWLTDPVQAAREMEKMFTEKHDAWTETVLAISQTPMQMWFDIMNACWNGNSHHAVNDAVINSSRRVAHPSNSRVKANRKRLGNLH